MLELWVQGLGFRAWEVRVQGSGFRVDGGRFGGLGSGLGLGLGFGFG